MECLDIVVPDELAGPDRTEHSVAYLSSHPCVQDLGCGTIELFDLFSMSVDKELVKVVLS